MSEINPFEEIAEEQPQEIKPEMMDRGLAREIKREARYFARLIPDVLADIGLDHWLRKEARPELIERYFMGKRSRQKIRIMHVAYNEAAIYLRIDPLRLPYKVRVLNLRDEDTLETLSVACGRRVTFQLRDPANGCWLVIDRGGVLSSIPKLFRFRDAINHVPKTGGPLRYCAGVGENMKLITPDLERMPHLIIAGATSMGKSVHENAIICQLLWRNSPDMVKFLMIDLKSGMELQDYAGLDDYLWRPIVTTIDGTVEALKEYREEMQQRQVLFRGKARSLVEWNRLHKNKLPYIVMIIDELAMILLHPVTKISNRAKIELAEILSVSRATGGHAILCTQRPSMEVLHGYIKANTPSRVAFGTATQADSRVIIDQSMAAEITLPGRAWFLYGAKRYQIQTPWISPTMIRRTVKAIIEREKHPYHESVDIIKIAEVSLERFDGSLSYRLLYGEFKGRISERDLRTMLSSFDNEIIELDGKHYKIMPSDGGQIPRRLQVIQDQADSQSW